MCTAMGVADVLIHTFALKCEYAEPHGGQGTSSLRKLGRLPTRPHFPERHRPAPRCARRAAQSGTVCAVPANQSVVWASSPAASRRAHFVLRWSFRSRALRRRWRHQSCCLGTRADCLSGANGALHLVRNDRSRPGPSHKHESQSRKASFPRPRNVLGAYHSDSAWCAWRNVGGIAAPTVRAAACVSSPQKS